MNTSNTLYSVHLQSIELNPRNRVTQDIGKQIIVPEYPSKVCVTLEKQLYKSSTLIESALPANQFLYTSIVNYQNNCIFFVFIHSFINVVINGKACVQRNQDFSGGQQQSKIPVSKQVRTG